ncbi:polyhydroxyalkanoate depolymerase [Enterovirga rhinocerotis]|uniref:Poly(3-hydroxybutyrate) depolymerase n=1 Tax=Enterovirga rhinocerotis TaxID=1339210 RepID=A0A4R7BV25_9HYPH|nr:polyhydroxyalkanoate depolymerase [Enterovirga rhinocerotis]TDR89253.1 poly(3-hydroxybutyrate) depolymerase [Enterovirga rhinocerotis]
MDNAYFWYDAAQMWLAPARAANDMARLMIDNPLNPLRGTPAARSLLAACEMFERMTRRYEKPAFGLASTMVGGERVAVTEEIVWSRPFGNVIRFRRGGRIRKQPKLLIVAPMSGHYATLLRGTVEAFLPTHDVMITDWADASMVPLTDGFFGLDDYIDYVKEMCRDLGPDLHLLGVCQPSVPVIAAVARLEAEDSPHIPLSMTLMGGPVDTRRSPTAVNLLAEERGVDWFKRHCIHTVPFGYPGAMRQVYPGFLQLSGFMAMNLDRHVTAHRDMFNHLVRDDGDAAEKHREFYDEYLAVMDLTAEFYLETVEKVFVEHCLPKGEMTHRGQPIDLMAIRRCAIMAVEGEKDDISGIGQTLAALDLTPNLSSDKKAYHLQPRVGHYGVFNGSRFRAEIAPRITDFTITHDMAARGVPIRAAAPARSDEPELFPHPAEAAGSR